MAGSNIHYDTRAMRDAADRILEEVRSYDRSKETIDTTVESMRTYWDDSVNQNYVSKYNKDLEPTAASVGKLMREFAKFLRDSAEVIDKAQNSGNSAIN